MTNPNDEKATADDLEDVTADSSILQSSTTATERPDEKRKTGDAFSELMKPKKPRLDRVDTPTTRTAQFGRDGLGVYTADPASFPSTRVVYYNDDFVIINDLYPKASVHLLILPRDPIKSIMQPQNAFDDPTFLDACRKEEKVVRGLVAEELRRRFGGSSASDRARLEAMESDDPPLDLPSGRDWEREIISGIHANPSMNHLHIHVLSRDMVSDPMRKANHYLSFTTDFLVNLDQFPLSADDHRRNYHHFPEDMICWRCGKNFGRKMTKLKAHLEEEFEEWKRL